MLLPALGALAGALERQEVVAEVQSLAREIVGLARAHPAEAGLFLVFDFLVTHVALEFEPQLRETLESAPPRPVRELALACLDRDFVRAAEMWAAGGSPPWEARLRLRAAEELIGAGRRGEGEGELHKALAFYRSVGATYYINRGEQLLARSA